MTCLPLPARGLSTSWVLELTQVSGIMLFHAVQRFNLVGGYSVESWVGRCCPVVWNLPLFKTQISDSSTLFKTEFRFFVPYLKHLINPTSYPLYGKMDYWEPVSYFNMLYSGNVTADLDPPGGTNPLADMPPTSQIWTPFNKAIISFLNGKIWEEGLQSPGMFLERGI